jgi:hypothetical protein
MKKKRLLVRSALAIMAVAAVVAAVTGSASNADPVGDHYVNNLGTGVTAEGFSGGNTKSDCATSTFLEGDYDLWHFVVNQVDGAGNLSWNAGLSVWSSPSSVSVTDVTTQYGNYQPGPSIRHLWIATTPPGATLESAYLNYTGTAGAENLSHTCARGSVVEPSIEVDPEVAYDMTWDWNIDKSAGWEVDSMGGYDVSYEIESTRSSVPRILPGTLTVTGNILVDPPSTVLTSLSVSFSQGSYTQACTSSTTLLTYSCALDSTKVQIDSATGRPTGAAAVSTVAGYAGGTMSDSTGLDFDDFGPAYVYASTASIFDDNATPTDESDDRSTESDYLSYDIDWYPAGDVCVERTNTALLVIDDKPTGMVDPSDSVTIRWCPPLPGRTIGYWGNKMGAPDVIENLASLKTEYPAALAGVGPFAGEPQVRGFFRDAKCSGDCKSMFQAQFLAAAMNAIDDDFAEQGVMLMGECWPVADLLDEANDGVTTATKAWYTAWKSLFDAINNSRQSACLTVSD